MEQDFSGWPAAQRNRATQEIMDDNDNAERLGFTCHPDDRLGFGRCYFMKGGVRVWNSPDGWCRATCTGVFGHYTARELYHTQNQALVGERPFARLDKYGQRINAPQHEECTT